MEASLACGSMVLFDLVGKNVALRATFFPTRNVRFRSAGGEAGFWVGPPTEIGCTV